jgi:HD superfamily phosphohydrolase
LLDIWFFYGTNDLFLPNPNIVPISLDPNMNTRAFADIVHDSITFSEDIPSQRLILSLIDTKWFQRLRDVSQTANTRLVFMFSEHSRFGHCVGAAYLAEMVVSRLLQSPELAAHTEMINYYRNAIAAVAILHDLGHLAPGSHMAFRAWFPKERDSHEELGLRIIEEDDEIQRILRETDPALPEMVRKIILGDPSIPPWCYHLTAGGGWNVDRGNWLSVDSVMAGVHYGLYNVSALVDSLTLTPSGELALRENRLDAMLHFAVSRHAMYRQLYQHRTLLAADILNQTIVKRARDIRPHLPFVDGPMERILESRTPKDLDLDTVFHLRESWWRYHITRWASSEDPILSDLCNRLLHRRLFKTVAINDVDNSEDLTARARDIMINEGWDPTYYLHTVRTADVHKRDTEDSLVVIKDSGEIVPLTKADPLFSALGGTALKKWLVMPERVKSLLGRKR